MAKKLPEFKPPQIDSDVTSIIASGKKPIEDSIDKIYELDPAECFPFKNSTGEHPFHVRPDSKDVIELLTSVKEKGILDPASVRRRPEGGYEILAGHKRHYAASILSLKLPAIIKNCSDDEKAYDIMKDSNIQRKEKSITETAKLMKMEMDRLNRQGKKASIDDKREAGEVSRDIIAKQFNTKPSTVQKYLRFVELIVPFQYMVDDSDIPQNAGADLSYINKEGQQLIYEVMLKNGVKTINLKQAAALRVLEREKLNDDSIARILSQHTPKLPKSITFPVKEFAPYFPPGTSTRIMRDHIIQLLKQNPIA